MSERKAFELSRRDLLKTAGYVALAGGALGGLAGCGPKGDAGTKPSAPAVTGTAKKSMTVWLFKTFVDDANAVLEKQVRAWAAKNSVELQLDFASYGDYTTKYAAAVESGNVPDVGELGGTDPVRYAAMGLLLPVTDAVNKVRELAGGFVSDKYIDAFDKVGNDYYAMPKNWKGVVMFVRSDKLQEKGLKAPTTYDELVTVAKGLHDPGNTFYGLGQTFNRCGDSEAFLWGALFSFGGSVADATGKKVVLDSPETRQMVQWCVDTVKKHDIQPPGLMGWNDSSNNEAYIGGKIGITFNSPSIYYTLRKQNHPLTAKTLMTISPQGPKGRFSSNSAQNFGVFKKTKHPELARDLVAHLLSPEQFTEYMKASTGEAAPLYKKYATDPFWAADANIKSFVDNAQYAVVEGYPGPQTPAVAEMSPRYVLSDMVASVVKGTSIDEAVKSAQKKAEEIYAAVK